MHFDTRKGRWGDKNKLTQEQVVLCCNFVLCQKKVPVLRTMSRIARGNSGAVRLIGISKPWSNSAGDFLNVPVKDIININVSCP